MTVPAAAAGRSARTGSLAAAEPHPGPTRVNPARLPAAWLVVATAAALVALAGALTIGPFDVPPLRALLAVADRLPVVSVDPGLSATETVVITEVRLPRVVLGALVGAVLASAGGAYQATFRNPLADPYLLGVAGGAGFGVTLALTETGGSLGQGSLGVTAAAFAGALTAVGLSYGLGVGADRSSSGPSLILAGVAMAALFAALQTLLLQQDDEAVRDVYAWLLGRLNVVGWSDVRLLAPCAVLTLTVLLTAARRLDVLALGDEEASSLGIDVVGLRAVVITAATLGTAAAVAVSGLIGFVGIIVPHAVRLVTGPSNRRLLPVAALGGAVFLTWADVAARTLLAPAEIPIGVITAAVGAPFFLALLRARAAER
jgi:iron complex transport system permease protein